MHIPNIEIISSQIDLDMTIFAHAKSKWIKLGKVIFAEFVTLTMKKI